MQWAMNNSSDAIERLKNKVRNAPPEMKPILEEQLLTLAKLSGKYDEIVSWLRSQDTVSVSGPQMNLNNASTFSYNVTAQEDTTPQPEQTSPVPPQEPVSPEEPEISPEVPIEKTDIEEGDVGEVPEELVEEKETFEGIREDIEKEQVIQELADTLSAIKDHIMDLNERLRKIENAVAQHKRILDKIMDKEEGTTLEEKIEKLEPEDVVTETEFGVKKGNESSIKIIREGLGGEDMDARELRKARLKQIAEKKKVRAQEGASDLKDFYKVDEDIKNIKKVTKAPPAPPTTSKEDFEKFNKKEKEEIAPPYFEPHKIFAKYVDDEKVWLVLYGDADDVENAKVLAKVAYKEDLGDEIDFASKKMGADILKTVIKESLEKLAEKYGAEILVKSKEEEKEEEEKEGEKEGEEQKASVNEVSAEAVIQSLEKSLNLVGEMMNKNLVENPLKEVLFEKLAKAGVENPVSVIEDAFMIAGKKFLERWLSEAVRYMNLEPSTFAEIERFVQEAKTRIPEYTPPKNEDYFRQLEAMELRRRASQSVPLIGASETGDETGEALPKPSNYWVLKYK